ncbi:hypothetical protein ABZ707_02950 [Streptomyces sp. NPDC006923]|uniref:hypothetical protein n=1 Tax=Streptomyces sp. NPDC006923 TaxID=3155355 RepID=UPI0033D498D5
MTTYMGSGEVSTHRTDYTPDWLGKLAEDVTLEAAVMNGVAKGPEAVRSILSFARTLYDYQEFNVIGRYGESGFVEDYVATVRGEPIGSIVVIRYNEAGLVGNIVINHRPLRSVLLWSRIMAEHFAATEYGTFFLQPEDLPYAGGQEPVQ